MHRDRRSQMHRSRPNQGRLRRLIVSGTGGAFDRYGRCIEMTITKLVCTRGVTLAGCRREQGRGAVIARRRSQRTGRSPTGDRPIRQPNARPISLWVQTRAFDRSSTDSAANVQDSPDVETSSRSSISSITAGQSMRSQPLLQQFDQRRGRLCLSLGRDLSN